MEYLGGKICSALIHLTADAIVGVTWRMKRKKVLQPWAALRVGFTGVDWAAAWVDVMAEHDLPGPDFVVKSLSRNMVKFTPRIGTYNDGSSALRALLVFSGMNAEDALQFTLHSWRHLFPTAGRQLSLPEHEQVEMGHWTTGSAMPRRYDSAACVTELIAKSKVSAAFRAGWNVAEAGCVPVPPPPPCTVEKPSETPPAPPLEKKRKTMVPQVNTSILNIRRVAHLTRGKVHAWRSGLRTVCNTWQCGDPKNPAELAVFAKDKDTWAKTSDTSFCKPCFKDNLNFLELPEESSDGGSEDSEDFEDEDI